MTDSTPTLGEAFAHGVAIEGVRDLLLRTRDLLTAPDGSGEEEVAAEELVNTTGTILDDKDFATDVLMTLAAIILDTASPEAVETVLNKHLNNVMDVMLGTPEESDDN